MVAHLNQRGMHYLVLSAAALALFFWNLGGPSLWDMDEGKNATAAREMLESGDWVKPTFDGRLRSDKPALLYWLQATAYALFGINEFSARFPSALAALLTVLLVYELGRSMFGKTTGLLGGLICASTPMLMGAARFANPDSLLHLFTVLTLLLFWVGHRQPTSWWWMRIGAASGLATLAKGPIGFVLPSAIMIAFAVWDGRWRMFLDRRWWLGALVWTFVALPWYIWVGIETKARFLYGFFLHHNMDRFLDSFEGHGGTPFYYVLVLLGGLAPWSVFLFGALWYGFWSARSRPRERWLDLWLRSADLRQRSHPEAAPPPTSAYRMLLTWIGIYVVFFTLAATKLPNYVLPTVAPSAILVARMLDRWRRGELSAPAWCVPTALVFWLGFGIVIGIGLALAGGAIEIPGVQGRTIPGLAPLAWFGTIPLAGAVLGWQLLRSNRRGAVLACLAVAAVATAAPITAWALVAVNGVKAPENLVHDAGACNRGEDIRIVASGLMHLPSLSFYTQRSVIHVDTPDEAIGYLHFPIRVFVFLRAESWDEVQGLYPELGRVVARHGDLYSGREIVVVTNRL